MSEHTNIMQFDVPGLQALMVSLGEKPYRGRQLAEWLYLRGAQTFAEMDNLPHRLRQRLEEQYTLSQPQILEKLKDPDGTVRYVLRLCGGQVTETVALPARERLRGLAVSVRDDAVALPARERLTVCFSTQAGCALGCIFCATGRLGLARSLLAGEMLAQLVIVAADFSDIRISNVVAMGQGEPFANYEATMSALRMMNNPALFGIGARHLTVSSAGLISGLHRFADEPEQFTLAISLHSAEQNVRNYLMPGLATQPLDNLKAALVSYMQKTSRRPSLEYALIEGVNDGQEALGSLLAFCDVPAPGFHVNLLALNALSDPLRGTLRLQRASSAAFLRFERSLNHAGISVTRRASKGETIAAACGQLASLRSN